MGYSLRYVRHARPLGRSRSAGCVFPRPMSSTPTLLPEAARRMPRGRGVGQKMACQSESRRTIGACEHDSTSHLYDITTGANANSMASDSYRLYASWLGQTAKGR